ncbi:oxidoreductase [Schizopora paradoxa]|uniref:Oxidoreductase n=1 Tax=Schizopora paradoxa TaxID=27342 RepID=A0A0H2RQD1_9AGAM|nr:oxidoreductase [Schizopora paradoxa]
MPATTAAPRKTNMPYVRLGKPGLKVSRIILGCMSYGSSEWQDWVLSEEDGIRHIKAAYDAGIQTFDTAGCFLLVPNSPSESYYGEKDSENYGYVNQKGLSRKNIFESVKKSLERLQLDYVDVLQCHRFDPETPVEETVGALSIKIHDASVTRKEQMQALHDVVRAGYVRYIGMSSCRAWQFHVMQNYAINNHLTPFISMQNHYCLAYREEEREMFPTLKHFGVGSIPWSPLARGFLARPPDVKTKRSETDGGLKDYSTAANNVILNRVEEIANRRGLTMAQVALAWVMHKDGISAPIVGTTSLKNMDELIASVHIKLSDEEMKYLEEPYAPMA